MQDVDLGVCRGQLFPGDPDRAAVVLPGAFYLPGMPLLWFSREALQADGWTVLLVWDSWAGRGDPTSWAEQRLAAARDHLGASPTRLVVAKSMTSRALPLAARLALPGIWLTPLLRVPEVRSGAAAATVPTLLVGGTADGEWDTTYAPPGNVEVVEVDGADHSLQRPGDPHASLQILGDVVEVVRGFAARLT